MQAAVWKVLWRQVCCLRKLRLWLVVWLVGWSVGLLVGRLVVCELRYDYNCLRVSLRQGITPIVCLGALFDDHWERRYCCQSSVPLYGLFVVWQSIDIAVNILLWHTRPPTKSANTMMQKHEVCFAHPCVPCRRESNICIVLYRASDLHVWCGDSNCSRRICKHYMHEFCTG